MAPPWPEGAPPRQPPAPSVPALIAEVRRVDEADGGYGFTVMCEGAEMLGLAGVVVCMTISASPELGPAAGEAAKALARALLGGRDVPGMPVTVLRGTRGQG